MPKIVDVTERRTVVVTAVLQILTDGGVEGVTMREVGRRAGMSAGLIHHYFPGGRTELLHAAVTAAVERGMQRMATVLDAATGLAAVRGVALELLPVTQGRRTEWAAWMALWGWILTDPQMHREQSDRLDAWRALLATLMDQAVDAGELPADYDTVHGAVRLAGMLDGLGLHSLLQPGLLTPDELTAQLDDFLKQAAT